VLQHRGGIGLAVVIAVGLGALGCGGPLDSAEPRPKSHPDAGVDRGAGGKRVDTGTGGSPGFDAAPDVQWPVIPGCISGLPPSPQFGPDPIPPLAIGCASSNIALGVLSDAAKQGMVYNAKLDPPIDGTAILQSTTSLCGYTSLPLSLVVRGSLFRPGQTYATSLSITPVGPPPQKSAVFGLTINVVPIDFSVGTTMIDFGTVTVGSYLQQPIMITNALDGAPFDSLYATPAQQGPFLIYATGMPFGASVRPGETRQMFQVTLNPQATGTFDATFLVSAFQPGVLIDPSCGVIRSITMHVKVTSAGPPVP
jgi:hypothetical protein